jgi:hypothetical protein
MRARASAGPWTEDVGRAGGREVVHRAPQVLPGVVVRPAVVDDMRPTRRPGISPRRAGKAGNATREVATGGFPTVLRVSFMALR